jgi:hypothetical protein
MNALGIQRFLLGVVLLTATAPPVFAEAAAQSCVAAKTCSTPRPMVRAGSWGIGRLVGPGGRTRIVQICVVVMCIALFIMMKKLN